MMDSIKIGDKAPLFSALNQDDELIRLESFLGKKIVLYFYPRDNTPGCTVQACNLRDNYDTLVKSDCTIIGISRDTTKRHKKFIEKYQLPFNLVSDMGMEIHKLYNAMAPKNILEKIVRVPLRKTFIIDEAGYIEKIIEKVRVRDHSAQILGCLDDER